LVRISVDHLDDDARSQSLGAVLARSAAEMADLAERTERLQDVMAGLVRQCAALDVDAAQDMQALDWIAQHLEGLASFLDALSKEAGPAWLIDPTSAFDALNLAELAHRLRGTPAASAAPALASGEMELF
jgi:NADP-dependent 3-hydroxy acid dehydrogenase YdfG